MNATLLAALNDAERLLVARTERAELAALDEDAAIDLEARIRRARNKCVGQYRRAASARVVEQGARGRAAPENQRAALKAEAFEEALARQSAAELRAERLAAARAAKQAHSPSAQGAVPVVGREGPAVGRKGPAVGRKGPAVTGERTGDRALHSPASKRQMASTRSVGARRQAKRDSR